MAAPEPPARMTPPPLPLLVVMAAIGALGMNIIFPSLTSMQGDFGSDYATIQLTVTIYLVGLAVAQLAYGPISDRLGRRPAMFGGLALYILGGLICLAALRVEILLAGRLLQAVGGCAGMVLTRAIVRDVYPRENAGAAMGMVNMAMSLAPMLAPAIGGFLDQWLSWRASFALTAGFGVAVLGAAYLRLPETLVRSGAEAESGAGPAGGIGGVFRDMAQLFRSRAFLGYALQVGFGNAVFFAFITTAPFVAMTMLGTPTTLYGIWLGSIALGFMSGNFITVRLSRRWSLDALLELGAMFSLGGTLLTLLLSGLLPMLGLPMTLLSVFLPMILCATANGLTIANGVAGAASVNPRLAGTAAGLVGMLQMGVGAIGTVILGHWQDAQQDQWPMIGGMIFFALAGGFACILTYSARRRTR